MREGAEGKTERGEEQRQKGRRGKEVLESRRRRGKGSGEETRGGGRVDGREEQGEGGEGKQGLSAFDVKSLRQKHS